MTDKTNMGTKIDTYRCNTFIGREVFADNSENYVSLDLYSLGSINFRGLEQALYELCLHVCNGEMVLLNKCPGIYEREGLMKRAYVPLRDDDMQKLREIYDKREDMKQYPNPFEYQSELHSDFEEKK